jgi:hypothetical protein
MLQVIPDRLDGIRFVSTVSSEGPEASLDGPGEGADPRTGYSCGERYLSEYTWSCVNRVEDTYNLS